MHASRALAGVLAAVSLSACGEEPEATGPIRLVDRLDVAAIDSPVTAVAAAAGPEELEEVPRWTVFEQDFERFQLAGASTGARAHAAARRSKPSSWPSEHARILGRAGRRFLQIDMFRVIDRYVWTLPVEPSTYYVFERSMSCDARPPADFAIVETRNPGLIAAQPTRVDFMSQGPEVKLHWPDPVEPDGSWQRGSTSFFTTPTTRAVTITVRPTPERHERMLRWGVGDAAAQPPIRFDDVRLHRLEPTPEQMIALLKAKSPAPGADSGLGIAKRGQFPPLRESETERSAWHDNYSWRDALYAPPPTDLAFPLRVPRKAALYFSVCLSHETAPGDAARLEVLARTGGGEETLWSDTLEADPDRWFWHDHRVDLSPFAGEAIELVLRTRAEQGAPHPMWGNPVVDAPPGDGDLRTVVLIAVDTLRADRLSCYGYGKDTSPRIDALAGDGVRFENVASNATWTCPSFASIFTGLVPSRHAVWAYGPVTPLPARLETLAERFRAHGWSTHSIAYKAPLYGGGYEQGFDVAYNIPKVAARADENLAEAMEWLDANAGRRSFLFLHFDDPHTPFTQPPPFDARFGDDPAAHGIDMPTDLPAMTLADPAHRQLVRSLYDGEVAYADDRIGAFLDALRERGLYEDALIVFVSDHGEELWERGKHGHGGPRFHDEVVRVPLVVKPGAGPFARGAVVATQVRAFDVMPTLLELAGIPFEDDLDAESLVPLLGTGGIDAPDRVAVTEVRAGGLGVRSRRWKYVRHAWGEESLFDLRADPGETDDVAEQHPEVLERMRLQSLEYLLLRRPGRYVVGIGAEKPGRRGFRLRGPTAAQTLFGLHGRPTADGIAFRGRADGALAVVASLRTDGPVRLEGPEQEPARFSRYEAGDLARLLRDGERGAHFFAGPPAVRHEAADTSSVDLEQLEALRALGYTGDAPGGPKER